MALILILGFIAIIARIFYLSSRTPAQPPQAATSPSPTAAPLAMGQIAARARLELPRDAAIRSMALSGSRLAVQFEAPTGPGIAILDLESGKTLGRIEVGAESPR